ncbi:hypothetical protein GCM10010215_28110 [Streptomyces virginiae]|uniref:Uncharacterized protein n=1 Tax=Streptomyces virginiae TaxID=1961 RepID=A0ABQ3NY42_STRVG|nr:hypothetical protein GCM10010215_28110 [Streptomyces virginiae]GHI17695.1 hypothetical protein Scinn_71580 [Streptomyces virginiae]
MLGSPSRTPADRESSCLLVINGTDPTMDPVQVKMSTKLIFDRTPEARRRTLRVPAEPDGGSRYE